MNNWTTQPKLMEPQTVERIEIHAYLHNGIEWPIDAIIGNNDLRDFDFKGMERKDFDSLKDDVYSHLHFIGMFKDRTFQMSFFQDEEKTQWDI